MDFCHAGRARENLKQVGAVNLYMRGAVALLGGAFHRHAETNLSRIPLAADNGLGLEAARPKRVFQAEFAKHLHGIGADADAGANFAKLAGLLEDMSLEATLRERQRGGHAAETASHQCDAKLPIHRANNRFSGVSPSSQWRDGRTPT